MELRKKDVAKTEMTLEKIISDYILSDGQVISISVQFSDSPSATIVLNARKRISKNKIEEKLVAIRLGSLTHLDIVDDFTTFDYSDITLARLENGEYYLSLDPYGNTNIPNDQDNLVFKCKVLSIGDE
jgi:hypothetical protein